MRPKWGVLMGIPLAGGVLAEKGRETGMIKLKKAKSQSWNGYGFGTSSAQWVVAKDPSISVRQVGGDWKAFQGDVVVARGFDRAMCLESLAAKRPELLA